jgi:radical SAM superfamily enzyme YgiQ (UPF0313 family)
VVDWASYFKDNLGSAIIVGGVNITLYPEESFSHRCFDYGVLGEANDSFPALLSALSGKGNLREVPGIIYREGGKLIRNPPRERIIQFDEYPFPARHLLPNELYYSFTSQLKNFTIMVTSTGCPFKCSFCAIARLPYRERSVKNVVDEIEECYRKFKVREIDFFDATFFVNKERSLAICADILRRRIRIEWSCRSRVDVVDEDILKAAYSAGCRKIYYGIESASERVLDKVNKGINREQIARAIKLTHKHGISALGFFMVGNPLDDEENILSSIQFAKELKLDFIQVCRAIAKPNTELNDALIKDKKVDYWREYVLGARPEKRLPAPWTDLSESRIEDYVKKFYGGFYFRPGYIFRRICGARSLSELFRYARAALRWVFSNRSDTRI